MSTIMWLGLVRRLFGRLLRRLFGKHSGAAFQGSRMGQTSPAVLRHIIVGNEKPTPNDVAFSDGPLDGC